MHESIITTGMLLGGLGLFMLAVGMITDGFKHAAGHALREMLSKWTSTPLRGIITGISITAIVQSSSAITVATIGFVNAGLMSMQQAVGVVYGANIGTTMTGWLVAMVGFKIKLELFALPIIGIGMLLRLTGGDGRRGSIGLAMVGFGLFFIGIDVLKESFEGFATAIDLQAFTLEGVAGVLFYVGIGFLMTVLTQSSSAAIAITLTAATGGVLGLYAAAAMVIGANVGTTSTAAIAVVGATPNARRVAAAHIIFNLITGLVALIFLPVLFWVVKTTGHILALDDIPAITLALFHTTFNIFGVLIMLPFTGSLTRFLMKRFVTQEEIEGSPQYLDQTVAVSPMLALNALVLELTRIAAVARRMSMSVLSVESVAGKRMASDHMVATKLANAVAEFIKRLERSTLSEEIAGQLMKLLRAEQHLLACADQVIDIASEQSGLVYIDEPDVQEAISAFRLEAMHLLEQSDPAAEAFSFSDYEAQLARMQLEYDEAKAVLLHAGAELRIPIPLMIETLEQTSRIRRMARQMFKAIRYLSELYVVSGTNEQDRPDDSEDESEAGFA